jgi:7,8-dihydropterin-6-yl-methyl-4-(beta-D-ribofuranosyl)aminobenzene 5'-phosphate synthase
MKILHVSIRHGLFLLLLLLAPLGQAADGITILYDAFGRASASQKSDLQKDWGFAALIQYQGKRILFDTGDNAEVFAHNVNALNVNLADLDFAVISHRHSDHISGIPYLLRINPKLKIYAPKENFGIFGSSLPSSFYRKDTALPVEKRYFDGQPPEVMSFGRAWPSANFELVERTAEVAPGIFLIALVSSNPGTLELRELSLAIKTDKGLVLVVGCSHPGIENIVSAAKAIDPRIHLIVGGMHLVTTPDEEIRRIALALKDQLQVELVAPGHCTGEPAFAALAKEFGDRYLYAGLGTVISLGEQPRSSMLERGGLSADELEFYRTLLAAEMRETDTATAALNP